MKPLNASPFTSITRRLLSLGVAGVMTIVSVPALAAAPAESTELAEARPECAQVVELRYFGGLTMEEIATTIGVRTPPS